MCTSLPLILLIMVIRLQYFSQWNLHELNFSENFLFSPTQKYTFHSSCQCFRTGRELSYLEKNKKNYFSSLMSGSLKDGTYVGPSTCDQYTSSLGAGQKVILVLFETISILPSKKCQKG